MDGQVISVTGASESHLVAEQRSLVQQRLARLFAHDELAQLRGGRARL